MPRPRCPSRPHHIPIPTSVLALGFVLFTASVLPAPVSAFDVPPVTVTQLYHGFRTSFSTHYISDGVTYPGPGYTSSGFSAVFNYGDHFISLIEAPPGMEFLVHDLAGTGVDLTFSTYWQSATTGSGNYTDPNTVTFENLVGTAPTETYSLVQSTLDGTNIQAWKSFTIHGDIAFTGVQVDQTLTAGFTGLSQTYGPVASYGPLFVATVVTTGPDGTVMELANLGAVPTRATTWGRLKALYRY